MIVNFEEAKKSKRAFHSNLNESKSSKSVCNKKSDDILIVDGKAIVPEDIYREAENMIHNLISTIYSQQRTIKNLMG